MIVVRCEVEEAEQSEVLCEMWNKQLRRGGLFVDRVGAVRLRAAIGGDSQGFTTAPQPPSIACPLELLSTLQSTPVATARLLHSALCIESG